MGPRRVPPSSLVFLALLLLGGANGCNAITVSRRSTQIGLLAVQKPADQLLILKKDVEGTDCPKVEAYGDYGAAIRMAIASVPGANVLTNVRLSSVEDLNINGLGVCVRATGDAARFE